MGAMEKMMSRLLRKAGKNQTLAKIAIEQLEKQRNAGLLQKDKANKLIEDIVNQQKIADEEQKKKGA